MFWLLSSRKVLYSIFKYAFFGNVITLKLIPAAWSKLYRKVSFFLFALS